jgi:hypothetical protein
MNITDRKIPELTLPPSVNSPDAEYIVECLIKRYKAFKYEDNEK